MSYSGANGFASGFAQGFGVVNSAINQREEREYRKETMQMQREKFAFEKKKYQREDDKAEMMDRVGVIRSLQYLKTSDDPEERKLADDILLKAGNKAFNEELGEGKRFAGFQMVPGQDRVLIKLDVDGYKQPAYVSENRSSDVNDPYVSLSGKELVDTLLNHPRAGEFKNIAKAAMLAAGMKSPESWTDPKVVGGRLIQTERTSNKANDLGEAKQGWNSALPEGYSLDKVGKTLERVIGTHYSGTYDSKVGQWFISDENKSNHNSSLRTASHVMNELVDNGIWIDPMIVATTVISDGKPLDKETATRMATEELSEEGHDRLFGFMDPSEKLIKKRTAELVKESQDNLPKILKALKKYTSGGQAAKPPSSNTRSIAWKDIPAERQKQVLEAANKDPALKAAFIKRFGQKQWDALNK